jgi:hypothetical protein
MKLNIFFSSTIFLIISQCCLAQDAVQTIQNSIVYNGQFQTLSQDNSGLINSFQFEGRFAVHLVTDNESNFFLLDLSVLNGEFEQTYFIKEIYNNQLFLQHGHGLPTNRGWIKTESSSLPENVITMLTNLLANVKLVSSQMSELEKSTWLTSQTN